MKHLHDYQKDFNDKFEFNSDEMDFDKLCFRVDLAQEEMNELNVALGNENSMDIVDALIDQIYIAYGTLNMLNVDIGKAFFEVHQANMNKERGKTRRGNAYDVRKPEGWVEPNHIDNTGILEELLEK